MDAIKKKMQGMKLEKDNAMDRALLCEQQARDANARAEKAEEEARSLQKKIQTIENELDQTQEALMQVNAKLEEKDKALQNHGMYEDPAEAIRDIRISELSSRTPKVLRHYSFFTREKARSTIMYAPSRRITDSEVASDDLEMPLSSCASAQETK
ncbi:hypothetical protein KM043_004364 [Ampulex compressa]|nr:hypothetical protein KM043_004364 [Ampulex compressa]